MKKNLKCQIPMPGQTSYDDCQMKQSLKGRPSMVNTDKNKSKKCHRKIRIRLVDPNIPDSYVCEIFDSSLENEEDISKNDEPLSKDKSPLKPKNYFELLMTKNCKKNVMNTSNNNEELSVSDDEKLLPRKQQLGHKNKSFSTQPVDKKKENAIFEIGLTENENFLQIQSKFKNLDVKEESSCIIDIAEEKVNEAKIKSNNIFTLFDSPKIELSQKKTFSILNYFSIQSGPKSRGDSEKPEEFAKVRNSLEISQTGNVLKSSRKSSLGETCKDEKKFSLNSINKENFKLAPLFYKKGSKGVDPARQKARLEFLFKGSPLSVVKKSESKTNENILNFPVVLHVQQRNDSAFWSKRKIILPLPELCHSEENAFSSSKKFRLQIKCINAVNNTVPNYKNKCNDEFLDKAKCKYVELNLDMIIDGLKEKRDRFLARTEEIEKSKTSFSQQDSRNETAFEELNALWTEKYKPKSSEIVGNSSVVRKLKKWLEAWKSFDEKLKVLTKCSRTLKKQKENDDESDDDFLDSRNENFGLKTPGNVCIISGPNGCGKTALVYALANELEFSVLELNASSKRTGKKVLSDLQEATRSHKVHRMNLTGTNITQKEVMRKRNNKRKKFKKSQQPVRSVDQANDCKISLILIEDADIVFDEHDEGFFSAIASLIQTSKRPLIFLTNQPNCHHLYNIRAEECLMLEMELPNFYKSCAILDIISSLEGTFFDKELLECLVRQNHFDLRKSLHQLQFWSNSDKNTVILQKQFDLGHFWWGLSKFLFMGDIKHFEKPKSCKRKRHNDLFDSSNDELETFSKKIKLDSNASKKCSNNNSMPKEPDFSIESYLKVLDVASVLDGFCLSGSKEPIPGFECKPRDSLSLDENMEEVSWIGGNLSEELSSEMVTLSTRIFAQQFENKNQSRKLSFIPPYWDEIRWRNSQEKASEELSVLVSLQRGRDDRSLHLDYLPVLRNICRIEKNRSEMNPKRKNRFYHYLNNLSLQINYENVEVNCDIFDR